MNASERMDKYWKEVIQVSTSKNDRKVQVFFETMAHLQKKVFTIIMKMILYYTIGCLVSVNILKYKDICPEYTPYIICVSSHKCAYISKSDNRNIIDYVPFLSPNYKCIYRSIFN